MCCFMLQLSGEEEHVPAEPVVLAMVVPPVDQHQTQTSNCKLTV